MPAQAREYLAHGFVLVPIPRGRKGPTRKGWNLIESCLTDSAQSSAVVGNVGLAHAYSRTCAVDVDDYVVAAAWLRERSIELDALLTDDRAVRINSGRPGRTKLLYRLPTGVEPLPTTQPPGSGFELRCASHAGKTVQDVLPPSIHPDTREPYVWGGHGDWRELPCLPAELLALWRGLLAPTAAPPQTAPDFEAYVSPQTVSELRSALNAICPDDYATWVAMGCALSGLGEVGRGLWLDWSQQSEKYKPSDERRWATFRADRTSSAAVFATAQRFGWVNPRSREARGDEDEAVYRTLTDMGNGRRLAERHGTDLLYCHPWGKWLVWDGRRWALDQSAEVMRRAKDTAASIFEDVTAHGPSADLRKAIAGWAFQSHKRDRLNAMVELAKSEPGIPIMPEQLDRDGMLLCVQNGTLDLRTGELRPHRREDYITKLAPVVYDSAATAPTWQRFLRQIFAGNAELIGFLQRAAGYSLTGHTGEQCLFILHGTGANGKSTLLEALQGLLGSDYARQAAPNLLLASKSERHPTELAGLAGARLVSSVETGEGRRLDENLAKQSTGGDKMKARRMREDFWEFQPEFKLWLATNHRPTVRGSDHAIWRRIRLVPFEVTIPPEERDSSLPDKLKAELPGILAWAVQGCLTWQRDGLKPPAEVLAATEAYRTEQDMLGAFLAYCCLVAERSRTMAGDLFSAYRQWCTENNEHPVAQRRFGMSLTERGFINERNSQTGRKQWRGIGLTERTEPDFPIDGNNSLTKGLIRKSGSVRSVRSVARLWNWQATGAPEPERHPFDAGVSISKDEAARRIATHYRREVARCWPAGQEAAA